MKKLIFCIAIIFVFPSISFSVRLKDIAQFKGIRSNQLVGYGIVVGLDGTGDKAGTVYTAQAVSNMLKRMGVNVSTNDVKPKNVAAVIVTADLPPFARTGDRLDVSVASVGDSQSLSGGTLLMTPLKGADSNVYAVAQGSLVLGGYSAGDGNVGTVKNHLLVGNIPGGAIVEKEVKVSLEGRKNLMLSLDSPDFTTAVRAAQAINDSIGEKHAKAVDSGGIEINVPESLKDNVPVFIAAIENLEIETDSTAKVVVNEKTGTIVIGKDVKISKVALTHGGLSITVREQNIISQPPELSDGETVVEKEKDVAVNEEDRKVMIMEKTASVEELSRALNALGVTPRDMISIFQALKKAGALHAKLEII
ncbi:MAG: flagellar basal body P-ring protein FlgI [Desulfobacteraceae bacterium]|nr:flagellar basal body P-ring protein FlgI [Desulfobacteraceae bacterium]